MANTDGLEPEDNGRQPDAKLADAGREGPADDWGHMTALAKLRTLPAIDALLAATARCHRLSVVTRNVADFAASDVAVVNPWQDR